MAWLQCIIETTQNNAEQCSECLMNAGAVAVTFEDAKDNPLFEPAPNTEPLWDHTRVIGLFESSVNLNEIKYSLQTHLEDKVFLSLTIEILEEKDWVSATNQTEAIDFGNNLWIVPSNQLQANPLQAHLLQDDGKSNNKQATYVILDAGLAFGTGSHPTTALCLKWLAAHPPKNKTVLDYGCGSGILGIAAKKLAAKLVYAVDHDPQALYSTKVNAEKNALSPQDIKTLLPQDIVPTLKVDLILANILAEPLLELAPQFAQWLSSKGVIILSGILNNQVPMLKEGYSPWFTHFKVNSQEEWARIEMVRI